MCHELRELFYRERLKSIASVLTGELYAVLLADDYIRLERMERSILFVSLQNVITAIISLKYSKHILIALVCAKIYRTLQNGYSIAFCRALSPVGILGNAKADGLASSSKNLW